LWFATSTCLKGCDEGIDMARYTKKLKAWCEDEDAWDYPIIRNDVTVCDHEAVNTGLLDADGDEIWREPNPVGFGRDDEW